MKFLITSLIFSSFSFSSHSLVGKSGLEKKINYSITLCDVKEFDDSLSTKVFVCRFLTIIDQEVASKIDAFVIKRIGVVSCETNWKSKQISISVDGSIGVSEIEYIFDSVKKKFLGQEDFPIQHPDCRH